MAIQVANDKALSTIEKLLPERQGRLTAADAAAATGLPLQTAKDNLNRLIELYRCRISMQEETGDVLYIFEMPLIKRGSKTWKERLVTVREAAWKGFKYVYKASIGIILVGYTVIFVALMLALLLRGGSDDNDRGIDLGDIFPLIFRGLLEAFYWHSWHRTVQYAVDPEGYQYRVYAEKEAKKGKKNFVRAAYDFVFGPEYPEPTEEELAREAAAFIRANSGKMTSSHALLLYGGDYSTAEGHLADAIARFGGDAHLTDSGVVVGDFEDFSRNKASSTAAKPTFFIDTALPPAELTGNGKGMNTGLIAMNTFNLAASFVGLQMTEGWLSILLGYFPMVFSLLFFAIPAVRLFRFPALKNYRKETMLRKRLLRSIAGDPVRPRTAASIVAAAQVPLADEEKAIEVLARMTAEMQGTAEISSEGKTLYSYPRMGRELLVRAGN